MQSVCIKTSYQHARTVVALFIKTAQSPQIVLYEKRVSQRFNTEPLHTNTISVLPLSFFLMLKYT